MRKYFFLVGIFFLLAGSPGHASGKDLDLTVKEFSCADDGVHISYSVKNERNFTRPNVKIGFKVLVDDKPIGCKVAVINIPVNTGGDQVFEVIIPAPCKGKSYKLVSAMFGSSIKTYKITNWMSECPK